MIKIAAIFFSNATEEQGKMKTKDKNFCEQGQIKEYHVFLGKLITYKLLETNTIEYLNDRALLCFFFNFLRMYPK